MGIGAVQGWHFSTPQDQWHGCAGQNHPQSPSLWPETLRKGSAAGAVQRSRRARLIPGAGSSPGAA